MKPSIRETPIEIDYTNTPVSIGSWQHGPYLLQIQHAINDYALICFPNESAKWHKIQYSPSGRAFIRSYGWRYYMDECIRY